MKITIEGASEEFAEKLVVLAAQHRAELTIIDTEWTVERAEHYLRSLPAGARRFAEMVVVDGDGYLDADALRREFEPRGLRGPTVALSRAIPRGVREGWWPEGTSAPINAVWDPDNPSWQKAIAYQMTSANVPVFREALAPIIAAKAAAESLGPHPGGTGKTSSSGSSVIDPVTKKGFPGVNWDLDSTPADEGEQP